MLLPQPLFAQLIVLLLSLCLLIYTSEIILPFSLLTVFSDHLTMSYIFHIALSNEMKMEKSIGEGQKTEN